jgi:O-succinylbenzoic acid--CoA ligase
MGYFTPRGSVITMSHPVLIIHGLRLEDRNIESYCLSKLEGPELPLWEQKIFQFILSWIGKSDYIIQSSSGTTGHPKEFRLLKESMIQSAMNTCQFLDLTVGQTALLCLPVDYIAGKMMLVRSMVARFNLVYSEPRGMPESPTREAIDFCALLPLQLWNWIHSHRPMPNIRKILLGGTEISAIQETHFSRLPGEIYAGFGMAETCSHIALRRINGPGAQKDFHTMPGVQFRLDKRGCLVISANYLPHQVVTNDLVKPTGPNSFIWLGRYDNLLNLNGIKIVPEEAESLVVQKLQTECLVTLHSDELTGIRLAFYFEQNPALPPISDLSEALHNILPRQWQPVEIRITQSFPRNANGKVDRKRLSRQ